MVGGVILIAFKLIGALGLFMYGMQLTSDGIQRAAGDKLQRTVNFMTKNRLMSVLTGILVTVLIQSSSATTVMLVSFVNAGLLSFIQSIGVIMGANIGTTLTGWIIASVGIGKFSIVALAVPIFGIGFFLSLMKKRDAYKSYGENLMGFALIFLGLEFLAKAIPDPTGDALLFLRNFADKGWIAIIICVLVGIIFTMLINASSATIAVVIGLAAKGIISFEMAAAITLGANIGTTFDSFLVSLGTNTNAKRAAWAHILFNIIGTIWVVIVFKPFLLFVDWVTPGEISAASAGAHIAMLHTMFNAVNTLVLFPFVPQYAALVSRLIPEKPGETEERKRLSYVAGPIMVSPELNLVHARKEIANMAGVARSMFSRFRGALRERPDDFETAIASFKADEELADRMKEELTRFLLEVTHQDIAEKTQANIQELLHVVDGLENITDSSLSLAYLVERSERKKLTIDKDELESLAPYTLLADEFLRFVEENASSPIDDEKLSIAAKLEDRLDTFRADLKKKARKRLKSGADVRTELLFIDMVRHIEKIGDYAFDIAESLRALR